MSILQLLIRMTNGAVSVPSTVHMTAVSCVASTLIVSSLGVSYVDNPAVASSQLTGVTFQA